MTSRGVLRVWATSTAIILLCAMAAGPSIAFSQSAVTATLRGTVSDGTGAVLPGVTLTLTNSGTLAAHTATSDGRGEYAFVAVFPGEYTLLAEIPGFKAFEQQRIVLSPHDARALEVRLELGPRSERVTVRARDGVVPTETGAREAVLTASQIENLAVISRNSLELLRILPGVVAPEATALESVSFLGGASSTQGYTVNGVRSSSNTVSLDGSALIDIGANSGLMITPNNEMVQEVKVQSSNYAAEHGTGAVLVSAVTKSGTSRYRGTLYDYSRTSGLAANDRSNVILNLPKPESSFHYPGGNAGGPIPIPRWTASRDRLFFFVGLELQRQTVDLGAKTGVVPTLLQRQGLFAESAAADWRLRGQPNEPARIPRGFANAGQPAPGGDLRPYIHPLGQALIDLYPLPTGSYAGGTLNYATAVLQPNNRDDVKARVDVTVSASTRAYVRMARENENTTDRFGSWGPTSDVALPTPGLARNRGRSYAANIVSVLGPAMTSEILISWSRLTLDTRLEDASKLRLDGVGASWTGPFPGASPYVPSVFAPPDGISRLTARFNDLFAYNDTLQISDRITKIAGGHAFRVGASVERLQKQQIFNNDAEGLFVFRPDTPGSTGTPFGNVLTGRPILFRQGNAVPTGHFRMWNVDVYAQDSWRVRPTLTLEYGVRAGYWTNNAELGGRGGWFDPARYDPDQPAFLDPGTNRVLNGLCSVADGCAASGLLPNRSPFAMPRLNAAWSIDRESANVIRGGYGLFFNRAPGNFEYNTTLGMPPAVNVVQQTAFGGFGYGGGTGLTYDTAREATVTSQGVTLETPTPGSFTFSRTHSFSVSYARRLPFGQVAEAAYVGTRGRRLNGYVNLNRVPEGALLDGTAGNADLAVPVNRVALEPAAVNAFRPFQAYGAIRMWDFEGESNYNALQMTLTRGAARHFQYFVAYTLSRTTGTLGGDYGPRDPFDARRTYGVADADRTHMLNVSWNALLPDAARGPLAHAWLRGVLDGWRLSGISTVGSGAPLRLGIDFPGLSGGAMLQAYYGTPDIQSPVARVNGDPTLAPEYTCDPRRHGQGLGEKVLEIGCISVPRLGEAGQAQPPYDLRQPMHHNHDITVSKHFQLPRNQGVQLRVGVFNVFNSAFARVDGINLRLTAQCRRFVNGVPNGVGGTVDEVCDPAAGLAFTDATKRSFGTIEALHGHRVVELALKYSF
jgi:hypothetical protein